MTIAEAHAKCKALVTQGSTLIRIPKVEPWVRSIPRDVLIVGVIVLSASASFGLGYIAGRDGVGKDGVTIEIAPALAAATTGPAFAQGYGRAQQGSGAYVASKNGTKYYLTTCSGAARISEANKIWFASAAAAQAAGYAPAVNCPGL